METNLVKPPSQKCVFLVKDHPSCFSASIASNRCFGRGWASGRGLKIHLSWVLNFVQFSFEGSRFYDKLRNTCIICRKWLLPMGTDMLLYTMSVVCVRLMFCQDLQIICNCLFWSSFENIIQPIWRQVSLRSERRGWWALFRSTSFQRESIWFVVLISFTLYFTYSGGSIVF